jgi:hypothetical protein
MEVQGGDYKLTADAALAAVTALLALFTGLLAWIAWKQLGDIKAQQRGWESLKACERYDSDPEITRALRRLRRARKCGDIPNDPAAVSFDFATVLNYLEALATGIEQGFYDEKIVRDHMQPIADFHIGEVFAPLMLEKLDAENPDAPSYRESYARLLAMHKRWTEPHIPWYVRTYARSAQ